MHQAILQTFIIKPQQNGAQQSREYNQWDVLYQCQNADGVYSLQWSMALWQALIYSSDRGTGSFGAIKR